MNPSRLERKVGLFVFIGLVLVAILLIQFSKGTTFFRPTYDIVLRAVASGELKPRAQVLMSGVQVGTVGGMRLAPDGRSVAITLRIYRHVQLHKDARFVIAQSSFLGDQHVAILPTKNEGPIFGPGDEALADAPLDIQEAARSAVGLIQHIDSAATNLNDALVQARQTILSVQGFTNLAATFDNFYRVSERSLSIAGNLGTLVDTNAPAITTSVSNILFLSERLNQSAAVVQDLLATNSSEIGAAVRNLESSTATLKEVLEDVRAGKGLAGKMLENGELAANVSQITSNLSITTSNLNRLGLWGILWQRHPPRSTAAAPEREPLTAPKHPFE